MYLLDTFLMYMEFPFVRRAFIVGILIALSASLLGVTLVLKRFSHIGDGLSHVAFGAMCIAAILHIFNDMLLILPVTIICALLLLNNVNKKIKGDAAIAMFSVSSLAIGYLFINIFSESANVSGDVCSTLFGATSILTLNNSQVWLSVGLAVTVLLLYVFFYNKIFAITFDEDFAAAVGINIEKYNLLISVVIAVIIVLAMKLVGSLLISALIVFPTLSSVRLFKSYKSVIIFSSCFAVICTTIGMIISIVAGTPVGSTIVAVDIVSFAVICLISEIRQI